MFSFFSNGAQHANHMPTAKIKREKFRNEQFILLQMHVFAQHTKIKSVLLRFCSAAIDNCNLIMADCRVH